MLSLIFFMPLFVGTVVLFIVSLTLVECSAGCWMNSIVCVFETVEN